MTMYSAWWDGIGFDTPMALTGNPGRPGGWQDDEEWERIQLSANLYFEVALFPEDFIDEAAGVDEDDAWDACKGDIDAAEDAAREELAEVGVPAEILEGLKLEAQFLEFDSGNISHAGGIFEVRVYGPYAKRAMEIWENETNAA